MFAQRLSETIAARGLPKWRLALDAGMTPKRLSRLLAEFPLHGPTLDEVVALARILSVSPAWLVGWDTASTRRACG